MDQAGSGGMDRCENFEGYEEDGISRLVIDWILQVLINHCGISWLYQESKTEERKPGWEVSGNLLGKDDKNLVRKRATEVGECMDLRDNTEAESAGCVAKLDEGM